MRDSKRNSPGAARGNGRDERATDARSRRNSAAERSAGTARDDARSAAGEAGATGRRVNMGPLQGYLGYVLRRAQMLAYADFIAALAELNLSPGQFGVLTVIATNPGLRQSEVSAALGIQKTNFVAVLNGFERRGVAVRKPAAGDRRSYALYLTPAGQALLRKARTAQARHEAHLVDRIGEQGREQLLTLLGRLTASE